MQQSRERALRTDQPVLAPLKLSTGRADTAETLRRFIIRQSYQPGDKLPSERELAGQLGISRTLLREAMSTLEGVGLIDIRHGSGSYVAGGVSDDSLSAIWSAWYVAHGTELVHLLQVREALEIKAAALAIAHAGDDLVVELQVILHGMERAVQHRDLDGVIEADCRFHGTIVAASGNTLLAQLLRSLDPLLHDDRRAVFTLSDRRVRSMQEHQRILDAIASRDPSAAQRALEQHFESVLQDVAAQRAASRPKRDKRDAGRHR